MRSVEEGALFGPDTIAARVMSESVLLLGGPRALLLQLAHPAVAAGVADHSDFRSDPFGRLIRTLDAMYTISLGSPRLAAETLARLRRVHDGVTGELGDGSRYRANDPALLLWVHATLIDTVLTVEERYLDILSVSQRAQFYEESTRLASAFEIPDALVPGDLAAFRAYLDEQVSTLEVSATARRLSRAILNPRIPLVPSPLWEPMRLVTVDLLPRRLRDGYGLPWDRNRKRLVKTSQRAARALLPRIPRPVRNLPTTARRSLARAS